jgi:hypothetical protein
MLVDRQADTEEEAATRRVAVGANRREDEKINYTPRKYVNEHEE